MAVFDVVLAGWLGYRLYICALRVCDDVYESRMLWVCLNDAASDSSARASRRRLSSEDSALVVRCVPDDYCSIPQLKKHFAKYGVTRVFVNSRQRSANVIFRSHVTSSCLLLFC